MGTKNNPGKFDCHALAQPDEPMFVLLGRDRFGASLVRLWAASRALISGSTDKAKIAEAMTCADDMAFYAENHGRPVLDVLEWLPFDLLAAEMTRRGLPMPVITAVPVVRDSEGHWMHPAFPHGAAPEECSLAPVFKGLGLEYHGCVMQDTDTPQEIQDECGDGDCSKWVPEPPAGEGWFLVAIHETEDGPAALWARQDNSRLWAVHIEGPDDVQAAPSWIAADNAARAVTARMEEVGGAPECKGVVTLWPFDAPAHADDLTHWPEFLASIEGMTAAATPEHHHV